MSAKNKHPLLEKTKKYWKTIIAMLIILILFSATLFWIEINDLNGLGKIIWHLRFFNHFFVEENNKFSWIGITSVLAIASLTFNAWDRRRQFNADLKSKSRIKWMAEVRPIVARFVEEIPNYIFLYHRFVVDGEEDLNPKLTEKMSSIRKDYYLIKLYVPTRSNEKLLRGIELLHEELHYLPAYYDYGIKNGLIAKGIATHPYANVVNKYVSDLINYTVEDAQEYFKDEWERAKRGE